MDFDHDSPGKVAGFRFRAGEDGLEEVAADPDSEPSPGESFQQKILNRSKKLLNKDTSLSDSEDNSESVKITEWWKDDEDVQVIDDKEKKKPGYIKVSHGREVLNAESSSEVEAGEEADEASGPLITNPSKEPETLLSVVINFLKKFYNITGVLTWLVPVIAATWVLNSDWWCGIIYGACFLKISQTLLTSLLNSIASPSPDIQQGAFIIPDYEKLPPLRASVEPHQKRGCFNVYNKPYDPETYSVRQTRTICLELDGTLLKLTKVKSKLSKKAHFSQTEFEVDSSRFTVYDLSRCTVMLLPHGLAQKRLFSKKYPITVHLGEGAVKTSGKQGEEPYHAGWENFIKDDNQELSVEDAGPITPALYLFARCDRDKEDWYRRLLAACTPPDDGPVVCSPSEVDDGASDDGQILTPFEQYLMCMAKFVETGKNSPVLEQETDPTGTEWLNALINRILYDVFRSPYWVKKIQDKLQRKLSLLKLPYYVEEMQIIELDLGRTGPVIHRVSKPIINERGLWFDLDLTHHGCIKVTIQTKLNLHKLQKGLDDKEDDVPIVEKAKSPLFDEEAEDSVESSSEEEESPSHPVAPINDLETTPKVKRKQGGFLRIVENVAQSRAFKHVAQTKVVQKVIANVSQTKLRLQVQLDGVIGTVAVNLPPPPSDRLWYGFRGMPKMWLTASPLVGEWSVTFSRVKHWIEKKLIEEFQTFLVLPNMNDIVIPCGETISLSSSPWQKPPPQAPYTDADLISLNYSLTDSDDDEKTHTLKLITISKSDSWLLSRRLFERKTSSGKESFNLIKYLKKLETIEKSAYSPIYRRRRSQSI